MEGETDEAIEFIVRIIGDDRDPDPDAMVLELAITCMMSGRDDDALQPRSPCAAQAVGTRRRTARGDDQFPRSFQVPDCPRPGIFCCFHLQAKV